MTSLIDNMIGEELFNPAEYTEKELLKLVYRELHTLRAEFDDYRKNNTIQKELSEISKRIVSLETEVAVNKKLQEESEKRFHRTVTIAAVVVSAFALVLKYLI